jgi:ABC-type uncharacterized transport system permease subunit
MELFNVLHLLVVVLYLAASAFFLLGYRSESGKRRRAAAWLAGIGFLLHTLLLMHFLFATAFRTLPSGYYIRIFSWGVVLVFFLLWWRFKVGFLALIASPLALLVYIASLALPGMKNPLPESLSGVFLGAHVGALFLCFGLLAVAFGAGLAFLRLNSRIKSKEALKDLSSDMPALSTFDAVNKVAVLGGFPLYTLGLAAGFFRPGFTWDRLIFWFSLLIWFVFAFTFYQRLAVGWRGRKPAVAAISLFLMICLSLAMNYFLPTEQSFHP